MKYPTKYLIDKRKLSIIKTAERRHKQYPQYIGHWRTNRWKLGIITQDIKTKLGLSAKKGEHVLYKKTFDKFVSKYPEYVFYSKRTNCDTIVPTKYIKPIR